jgi:hypothetical protein
MLPRFRSAALLLLLLSTAASAAPTSASPPPADSVKAQPAPADSALTVSLRNDSPCLVRIQASQSHVVVLRAVLLEQTDMVARTIVPVSAEPITFRVDPLGVGCQDRTPLDLTTPLLGTAYRVTVAPHRYLSDAVPLRR